MRHSLADTADKLDTEAFDNVKVITALLTHERDSKTSLDFLYEVVETDS